jgi:uncharacterized membrane protein
VAVQPLQISVQSVWILKGVFLGFGLFVGGLFLMAIVGITWAVTRGQVEHSHATGLSAVYGQTLGNPLFYLALLGCVLIGIVPWSQAGRRP